MPPQAQRPARPTPPLRDHQSCSHGHPVSHNRHRPTQTLVGLGQRVHSATGGLVAPTVITNDKTSSAVDAVAVFNDPEQHSHTAYSINAPSLYLIRPEGYVGFRGRADEETKLVSYLQSRYNIVSNHVT